MNLGKPTTPDDPRVERTLTMIGITRRLRANGSHPHCKGCRKVSQCQIPADPGAVVECDERPGPLFQDYMKRRGL